MSEERWVRPPEDLDGPPVEPESSTVVETPPVVATEPAPHARPAATFRQTALWLAALLALVIAVLSLSPFWAPAVAPLLPWATKPVPIEAGYSSLAARVAVLEERPRQPASDADALKSELKSQAQRVERLGAAIAANRGDQAVAAANQTALQHLTEQVAAIEARSEAQAANKTTEAAKAEQELGRLGTVAADLGDRLSALEQRVRAQGSSDRTGTALLIAMLQIRDAVEEGHPFPAAYSAFNRLAHDDPALIAAATPLAATARDGVPSRAALRQQLVGVADKVARADKPAGKLKWWEQALERIKRLVTIQRIGDAPGDNPEAAISAARSALAGDDLPTAVAALGSLNGSNADPVQPWLRMARSRLAAEAALVHLQELLAARLGAASTPPPAIPGANPAPPPTTSHTPS